MQNFRSRALAYAGAGAVGMFAAGLFAAPALAAAEADVSVVPSSTKIAAEAVLKFFRFDIKNAGPGVATGTTVLLDFSGLDPTRIDLEPFSEDVEETGFTVEEISATQFTLEFGDGAPGATLPFEWPFLVKEGATQGPAGSFKVTVATTATDPNPSNNTKTIPVEIAPSGPDLTAHAYDVYALDGEDAGPVEPGGTAPLFWAVINQGDRATKGLKASLTLPEHVTFVDGLEGFTTSPDGRTISIDDPGVLLPPGQVVAPEDDFVMVKVSKDAPGPVTLTGGVLTASAASTVTTVLTAAKVEAAEPAGLDVQTASEVIAEVKAAEELPAEVKEEVVEDLAEVDEGDNTAEFVVFVGAKDNGGGGGGELPVTGVQAGLIGGVGLAVVAGGGVLFLMARRRKVVLVTPDDETPTA